MAKAWTDPESNDWLTNEVLTQSKLQAQRDQIDFLGFLYDSTLGADAANFDITSGLTGAAWEILLLARGTTAAQTIDVRVRFNNDSGANYDTYAQYNHGANSNVGTITSGATSGFIAYVPAASAGANSRVISRARAVQSTWCAWACGSAASHLASELCRGEALGRASLWQFDPAHDATRSSAAGDLSSEPNCSGGVASD